MKQKRILVMSFLAAVYIGCVHGGTVTSATTVLPSPTKFFSTFSLADSIGKQRVGMCSGMAIGSTSKPEDDGVRHRRSDSFGCGVNDTGDKFKEKEKAFLESLKSYVEKQIAESGAKVVDTGDAFPAGFYFEYAEGDVEGRIEFISKVSSDNYYFLSATLVERSKD